MTVSARAPEHLASGKPADYGDFILRRRHRLVTRLLPPRGNVLLDFGCGNGAQTFYFAPHFRSTVGVDVDATHLQALRAEAGRRGWAAGVTALLYDGFRLPIRDAAVDYAISFEVLEHVDSESAALRELLRVLRPGGVLALSVPNRWWIFETHGAKLPLLPWNRVPFFSWLPKRIHDRYARARIYRRREIVRLLRSTGFDMLGSTYITAPMDVLRWGPLQSALRATLFRPDRTSIPTLSTAVLLLARRPPA
jgi:SAM-dependent methyltransferase